MRTGSCMISWDGLSEEHWNTTTCSIILRFSMEDPMPTTHLQYPTLFPTLICKISHLKVSGTIWPWWNRRRRRQSQRQKSWWQSWPKWVMHSLARPHISSEVARRGCCSRYWWQQWPPEKKTKTVRVPHCMLDHLLMYSNSMSPHPRRRSKTRSFRCYKENTSARITFARVHIALSLGPQATHVKLTFEHLHAWSAAIVSDPCSIQTVAMPWLPAFLARQGAGHRPWYSSSLVLIWCRCLQIQQEHHRYCFAFCSPSWSNKARCCRSCYCINSSCNELRWPCWSSRCLPTWSCNPADTLCILAANIQSKLPPKLPLDEFCRLYEISDSTDRKLWEMEVDGPHLLRILKDEDLKTEGLISLPRLQLSETLRSAGWWIWRALSPE